MMKFFVVFLAIATAVQADDWAPKTESEMKVIHAQCLNESQISEENIDQMKHFVYPNDDPTRTYILCCFKGLGLYDILVGFLKDRAAEQFKGDQTEAEAKPTIDKCFSRDAQDIPSDVETYNAHKCFFLNTALGLNSIEYINSVIYPGFYDEVKE